MQDKRNDHGADEPPSGAPPSEASSGASSGAPSERRTCLVCGRPGTDGPVILGKRLCAACERAIVDLDVGGRDYDFFVARIREAWRSFAGVEQ